MLVVSGMADVDALYDKVERLGHFAPSVDAWTAQVYRGSTFGDFFEAMSNSTDKPVLLTEYGVDAYHDVCGSNSADPCYNTDGDSSGSHEDQQAQAAFALNLTREIDQHASAQDGCEGAARGTTRCATIGGFLMSWVDEYWKGAKSQAECVPTYDAPKFSPATCTEKAHVTCGNWNASVHDLCGYQLDAAPDHYVNEEWFGITAPTMCAYSGSSPSQTNADGTRGSSLNSLRPRQIFWEMRQLWAGAGVDHALFAPCASCKALVEDACAAMGGLLRDGTKPPCSGRGRCATDWRECGPGGANYTATPCCMCDFGWAGPGCGELDARVFVVIGAVATLAALVLLRTLAAAARAVGVAQARALAEPLLS